MSSGGGGGGGGGGSSGGVTGYGIEEILWETYLSSSGDSSSSSSSSSGPNTTVFGSRECLIPPRCCMWLLSCRARGGHIPKPRETRSDTDAHEHANKQNYSSIGRARAATHRYPPD
ncbi:hypothetical protein K0M31_003681 [Melipona bicolor]|uniref:Uncharacterized protein n=1 Tax=Melipona bicolor TaxID=60889 RepID=A0AA40FXD5_9HYME|nr:hypothetical protein K0M31_003681 [Melipona bicolor]